MTLFLSMETFQRKPHGSEVAGFVVARQGRVMSENLCDWA